MTGFRAETLVAIEAVQHALAIARRGAGDITAKAERDLVTAGDLAVEDAVRSAVAEASGWPVIGEERGGQPPIGAPYWLLDPICGTNNFASGIPLYCVNLALVERDEITVAVVGDASTGGIDVAERGRGAWRLTDGDRHRLTTSDGSRAVIIEDGKSKGGRRTRAARFVAAAIDADRWNFRSLGTTLSAPYVAAGRVAGYVVFFVPALHSAAGTLLITEAGGVVSDIDGLGWTLASDSLVGSANRRIHDEFLDVMRAAG